MKFYFKILIYKAYTSHIHLVFKKQHDKPALVFHQLFPHYSRSINPERKARDHWAPARNYAEKRTRASKKIFRKLPRLNFQKAGAVFLAFSSY